MANEPSVGRTNLEDKPTSVTPTDSAPLAPALPSARPAIPDHQLLRRIGVGAYGEVWLARNVMGTYRAVKIVYRKTFSSDRPYEREFSGIHKFEPISRSHEGLVDVLQVGRDDRAGYFYYVMELADDAAVESPTSKVQSPKSGPAGPIEEVKRKSSDRPSPGHDSPRSITPSLQHSSLAAAADEKTGPREEETVPSSPFPVFPFSSPDTYVPKTLSKAVHDRGRLPANECLDLGLTLTQALGHLHQHGLIHRDIKPSNIIFVNGIPKLADIGLVADVGEARSYVGTEGFISDEGPGTVQADIYSLGKVLYEICTGKDRLDYPELPTLLGDGPDRTRLLELNEVIVRACARDVTKRYQSAAEMHADLVFLKSGQSVRRLHSLERQLARITRIAAGLLLIGVLAFLAYNYRQRQEKERLARVVEFLNGMEFQRVEMLMSEGKLSIALASLARVLRRDSNSVRAASRLLSVLSQRTFALPDAEPFQHELQIHAARFSPDGNFVVTASADKTARIWDRRNGKLFLPPLPHEGEVVFAQFSPDGKWVVTASSDGTARLWSAQTGQPLASLQHNDGVQIAQFSADGRRVVTASLDGTARVWEVPTGRPLTAPLRHDGAVICAQFDPDGERVVTGSADRLARVWDIRNPSAPRLLLRHRDFVKFAQFSPDGSRVVTASLDGTARVWDTEKGTLLATLQHDAGVEMAQFSPEGERIVTASRDKTARVWEARTGNPITQPLRHEGRVSAAAFSPDGSRVITASDDRTARVWEASTGQASTEALRHNELVDFAEFSPSGDLVITASADATARVWRLGHGGSLTEPLLHQSTVLFAQFSPNGDRIATVSEEQSDQASQVWRTPTNQILRLWQVASGPPLLEKTWKQPGKLIGLKFGSDGAELATIAGDGTRRVWTGTNGEPKVEPLAHLEDKDSPQFSSDGTRIIAVAADGTVRVHAAGHTRLLPLRLQPDLKLYSIELSPNGGFIVTASADKTARIWNVQTGQLVAEPLRHDDLVHTAQWSPSGDRIVTASADGTARIWDASTGKALTEPLPHGGPVLFARFSPEGQRVVTACADGAARVWDVQTGLALFEPFRHQGRVRRAEFSPDGQRVVTVSEDQTARVWETPIPTVPALAWLIELVESASGRRFNSFDVLELAPVAAFLDIRQRLANSTATDFWTRWGQWFLAEGAARKISAFSAITVADYVQRRIDENTPASLREALQLSPTNSVALARLARAILERTPDPLRLAEAGFSARRSLQFSPGNPEAGWALAECWLRQEKPDRALEAIDRSISSLEKQNWPDREQWRQKCQATRQKIVVRLNRSPPKPPNLDEQTP